MSLLHLSQNPRAEAAGWNFPLGISGFRFADLNRVRRIAALDEVFRQELKAADAALATAYEAYRSATGKGYDSKSSSDILIRIAPYLGKFIARIFQIETEYQELQKRVLSDGRIFDWKKKFLDKHVLKHHPSAEEMEQWDLSELEFGYRALADRYLSQEQLAEDPEKELAEVGLSVLEAVERAKAENSQDALSAALHDVAIIQKWSTALAFHPALKNRSVGFSLFKTPEALDYQQLVNIERFDAELPERFRGRKETRRFRDGFKLTDTRMTPRETLEEIYYCIYCHERDKDSCSKGYSKQGKIQQNPLGIPLDDCHLDEKSQKLIF